MPPIAPRLTSTPSNSRVALAAARITVATVSNIVGSMNVPLFNVVPQTLSEIISLADSVNSNRSACAHLAGQAAELIKALTNAVPEESTVNIDDSLCRDMQNLSGTLQSIKDFMLALNNRSLLSRFVSQNDDRTTIAVFRNKLHNAVQIFQVQNNVSLRISQNIIMQGQSTILQTVENIEKKLDNSATIISNSQHQSKLQLEPPPAPQIFFGRDDYVANVISILLSNSSPRLAILGPGGVGKTTVAANIFHNAQVKELFAHRLFISCEPLSSTESLIESLCIGFDLIIQDNNPSRILMSFCEQASSVFLILDNFETFWDADNSDEVEKLLHNLTSFNSVTLIITMRGIMRPTGIQWTEPFLVPLPVLSLEAGKQTYLSISQSKNAEGLDLLLDSVGHLPLAITLLANISNLGFTPSELLDQWLKERTGLLNLGKNKKSENLEVSIALSVNSPIMKQNEDALSLLKMISYLPGGLQYKHAKAIAGDILKSTQEAQMILFRTGLAYLKSDKTLQVLPPIRYFVITNHALKIQELSCIKRFYFDLLKSCEDLHPGDSEYTSTVLAVEKEKENIVEVFEDAMQNGVIDDALLQAIINFSEFLYWTIPSTALLKVAVKSFENYVSDIPVKAKLLFAIGRIELRLDDQITAEAAFHGAMLQFERVGDKTQVAQCQQNLGDIARMLDKYSEAKVLLTDAMNQFENVHEIVRAAQCLRSLACVAFPHADFSDAQKLVVKAMSLFHEANNYLGITQCIQCLGDIARLTDRHAEAKQKLTDAKLRFESIGDKRRVAQCLRSIGDSALAIGNCSEATEALTESVTIFQETNGRMGASYSLDSIGNVFRMLSNYPEANKYFVSAMAVFEEIEDNMGVAYCLRSIGNTEIALSNYSEAAKLLGEAHKLFADIGHLGDAAVCLPSLAEIDIFLGNYSDAQNKLTDVLAQFSKFEYKRPAAYCLLSLGNIDILKNNYVKARRTIMEAQAQFWTTSDRMGENLCLQSIGVIEMMASGN
ncbi:hypothetical protein BD410DRAFT_768786 [Rickenella mellea]|uniref:NACHT domain-containing protein n=1 Tax=Rickenella mellea TaxID=50990 RepID=A0A4Y7Q846_9AGAM|nr:hypothetical protein BD410DRAFT_768786 [Rickenella mellea]